MRNTILGLLFILITSSCDDGELTIETFNFGTAQPTTCNAGESGFFIYKTNSKEVLILKIDEKYFLEPTVAEQTIEITAAVEVIYRIYNDNISNSFLCTSPPPTSPNVIEEWKALSGTITIKSSTIGTEDTTNNSSKITGFNHLITIKNLNFLKPNGTEQLFVNYDFGTYKTSFAGFPTSFGADGNFGLCYETTSLSKLSKIVDKQALILEAPLAFVNNSTILGLKNYPLVNNVKLTYYLYKTDGISNSGICANATPTVLQTWTGTGSIDVNAVPELDNTGTLIGYKYTVTLKNVVFSYRGFTFKSGNSYNFGTFTRLN